MTVPVAAGLRAAAAQALGPPEHHRRWLQERAAGAGAWRPGAAREERASSQPRSWTTALGCPLRQASKQAGHGGHGHGMDKHTLMVIHGALMLLGWVVLLPLGIMASVFRARIGKRNGEHATARNNF